MTKKNLLSKEIDKLLKLGKNKPISCQDVDLFLDHSIVKKEELDLVIKSLVENNAIDFNLKNSVKKPAQTMNELMDKIETDESKDEDFKNLSISEINPVAYYLNKISKNPLLKREEEMLFAMQIESGKNELISAILHSPKGIEEFLKTIKGVFDKQWELEDLIDGTEEMTAKQVEKKMKDLEVFYAELTAFKNKIEHMDKRKLSSEKETIHNFTQKERFNIEVVRKVIQSLKEQVMGTGFGSRVLKAEEEIDLAKKELTQANLRLVSSVAKRYRHHQLSFLDLMQEGTLGLIKAIEKYDYRTGNKFSTYATWWIRQSISRAISDKGKTVRVPVHVNDLASQIKNAESKFLIEHGRNPSSQFLSEKLKVDIEKVDQAQLASKSVVSLDAQVSSDSDSDTFNDFLADTAPGIEDVLFAEQKKNLLMNILNKLVAESKKSQINKDEVLTEQEFAILKLRYGIYDKSMEKAFYRKKDNSVVEVPWTVEQTINGVKQSIKIEPGMKYIVNEVCRDYHGMPMVDGLGNPIQEIKEYTIEIGNIAVIDGRKIAILPDVEEQTLEEIGVVMSRTRERIRQIESKALQKLQSPSVLALFNELE